MKKLITGMLVSTLLFSTAFATTAFAQDAGDNGAGLVSTQYISFDSTMYLSDDAVSPPNVTYTYTLTPGSAGSFTNNGVQGTIKAGLMPCEGGGAQEMGAEPVPSTTTRLESMTEQVSFATTDYVAADNPDSTADNTVRRTVVFDTPLDAKDFPEAGIYHYEITETCTTPDGKGYGTPDLLNPYVLENEGDILTARTHHLYVTLAYVEDSDGIDEYSLIIQNVVFYSAELKDTVEVGDGVATISATKLSAETCFQHGYGVGYTLPLGTKQETILYPGSDGKDFVVTDTAFGTWAMRNKTFTFTLTTENIPDGTVFAALTDGYTANGAGEMAMMASTAGKSNDSYESTVGTADSPISYLIVQDGKVYPATRTVMDVGDGGTGNLSSTTGDASITQLGAGDSANYQQLAIGDASPSGVTFTRSADDEATFTLCHGQAFRILSVIAQMKFTVKIADPEYTTADDWGYAFYARDYFVAPAGSDVGGEMMSAPFGTSNALLAAATATVVVDPAKTLSVLPLTMGSTITPADYDNYWYDLRANEAMGEDKHPSNPVDDTWCYTIKALEMGILGDQTTAPQSADGTKGSYGFLGATPIADGNLTTANTQYWQGIDFGTVKGEDDTPDVTQPNNMRDLGIAYCSSLPDTGVVLDLAPYALIILLVTLLGGTKCYITRKNKWTTAERGEQ